MTPLDDAPQDRQIAFLEALRTEFDPQAGPSSVAAIAAAHDLSISRDGCVALSASVKTAMGEDEVEMTDEELEMVAGGLNIFEEFGKTVGELVTGRYDWKKFKFRNVG
ncbi:MAG: hypothetical protein ACU0CO_05585 [Shimia sp.]